MDKLHRISTIEYRWLCDDSDDIPQEHVRALEEAAQERITDMMRIGYTSGELHTNVCTGADAEPEDSEDGLSYTGWWNLHAIDQDNLDSALANFSMRAINRRLNNDTVRSPDIDANQMQVSLLITNLLRKLLDDIISVKGLQYPTGEIVSNKQSEVDGVLLDGMNSLIASYMRAVTREFKIDVNHVKKIIRTALQSEVV